MPSILIGDSHFSSSGFEPKDKYDYEYPDGLDLTPGSKLHKKIRDNLMERAFESARDMTVRHSDWNAIDHTLTAYIPVSEEEQNVKDNDSRKPVSIVFPNSYTVLETLLSYFVGAFLQDPIFRYEGFGPDDVIGPILLEKVIAQQCHRNKVGLNLHTQARDAFAYGFGVSTPIWVNEYGKKTVKTKVPGLFGSRDKVEILDNQLLFEGNALNNIDPYLYLPDTNVPIDKPQSGEFVGWLEPDNYYTLLGQERNSDGDLFNVKYIKALLGRKSAIYSGDNSGRNTKSGMSSDQVTKKTSKHITKLNMFVQLIPEEWGLGDSSYPEMWFFQLVQDEIICQARPANLDHNKFPVNVMAPDFDGYSISPVSRIEILHGMQGVLDFMFNSHVANVRKALNDMIVYDPYQINSNDLRNPEPGKLIRLRRPAWGRGVKDTVQQLAVNDVTRQNVGDSSWLVQWMERIGGADSTMQGSLRQGGPERLTSAEFQGTRAGGVTRLERVVKVMGMQGMHDIATFFGVHNKQLMSAETFIKITGDWQDVLAREFGKKGKNSMDRGRIEVSPDDLDIFYDVIVRDGSVPGGNFSQSWIQLFQTLSSSPELAQNFDIVRIFTHIARNLGAKNVNEFVRRGGNINPQSMADDEVQQQLQAGNLIPIGRAA
jgi:hypothetical protein